MTNFHKLALSAIVAGATLSSTSAFTAIPSSRINANTVSSVQRMVATTPADLGIDIGQQNDEGKNGSMMDLTGIAFSGLKGKALSLNAEDFPKAAEVRRAIPEECFAPETATSLGYLSVSLLGTAACTAVGISMLGAIGTSIWTLPIWSAYSAVTGTVAMGLWVLAHECGHGAFSPDKKLQDAIGFIIHSVMLVPYYSWQRSHAVHHQYTNHMELGETHVPEPVSDDGALQKRDSFIAQFGEESGLKVWASLQAFLHLVVGWPGYLLIGATGGPDRGMTNHFYPNPLSEPKQPKRELFPGNWKEKVYQSDIGIAAVVGGLIAWTACHGLGEVMALYGGPYLVINAWLVLYTWLQHTDVDVPHFAGDDHTYVKGALHTIDRPYDKLDPFGFIDFLHHKIGTTHVAHHFDSSIPHYKAEKATEAIKEKFPQLYLYDPTPIPEALWRVCKGCTVVEQRGDKWVWKNDGLEKSIEL
jgi:fatty acid desaturase